MSKMTESELIALLDQQEAAGIGGDDGDLQKERSDALDYFYGRAVGKLAPPEDETRSSFVSRDLLETVLWMMPSLLRVFISGRPVEFNPVGAEDVKSAESETDLTNHVFLKENNGFMALYQWFWDTLVSKNGYVHIFWDEKVRRKIETYSGLSPEELVLVLDDKTDVIEQGEDENGISIKIRRTTKNGYIRIDNVAPENMRIAPSAKFCLQEAPYVHFITTIPRSDLYDMGFDPKIVKDLQVINEKKYEDDTIDRYTVLDELEPSPGDHSMDEIEVKVAYANIDFDGDDKSELRRVIRSGGKLLDNEEVDEIALYGLTAWPLPHKHVGMSVKDLVEDLMEVRTALTRQMLDNTYATAHNELIINDNMVVDYDDFLHGHPGGIKRIDGDVQRAVMPNPVDNIAHRILPALDYFDIRKETRTGVGRATQGLDSDVLKESTKGAYTEALKKSDEIIETVARVFAETGVKDAFKAIHALLIKHQDKPRMVKILGEFVPLDPSSWRDRENVTVNVGLGNTSGEDTLQRLSMIGQAQEKAAQAGIVSPENVFNLAEDIVDKSGIMKKGRYFTHPKDMPQKEPDPMAENPLVLPEIIKQQGRQTSEQAKQQHEIRKLIIELLASGDEKDKDIAYKILELEVNSGLDLMEAGIGAELEAAKIGQSGNAQTQG